VIAMLKFLRLSFLRPIKRFLAQWISVSTEPTTFVRQRIRLGDTTNFLRATGFFVSAISSAFLAEVATLYLLGIGNLTEPYYWLFILLTAIPFILLCFLLVRLVAPVTFKDVLHLSFYPIGAGVFTGAVFALVASAVVALLVAVGYIHEIKYDPTQFGGMEQQIAVYKRAAHDCLKGESLIYTILATGLQFEYRDLKSPIDEISWLRPTIAILYLGVAARVFMAAVDRRKPAVFSIVLLAALVATGANYLLLKGYLNWNLENSRCEEKVAALSADRMAESALKGFALDMQSWLETSNANRPWNVSARAEGRALIYTYRLKEPIVDFGLFESGINSNHKAALEQCSGKFGLLLRTYNATATHTFYSSEGEWLTSFTISPADCAHG
jgi:hypothetical protein